jgi:hypothetical protein
MNWYSNSGITPILVRCAAALTLIGVLGWFFTPSISVQVLLFAAAAILLLTVFNIGVYLRYRNSRKDL